MSASPDAPQFKWKIAYLRSLDRKKRIELEKITESELTGLKLDTISRKAFLRKSFRLGGIGALLLVAAIVTLVLYGRHLSPPVAVAIVVLAFAGLAFEFWINFRARRSQPLCTTCKTRFSRYLNADRPDDTEYLYVCHKCESFFRVLYGEEPRNHT